MTPTLRLRHGLLWRYTYIPLRRAPSLRDLTSWTLYLAALVMLYSTWHLQAENKWLSEQNAKVTEELHAREEQLLSCLNGHQVGWFTTRTDQVYVVCRPAEQYPISTL